MRIEEEVVRSEALRSGKGNECSESCASIYGVSTAVIRVPRWGAFKGSRFNGASGRSRAGVEPPRERQKSAQVTGDSTRLESNRCFIANNKVS